MDNSSGCTPTSQELVAGKDHPRTYREFVEMFPDDETCLRYIESLRWPDGFFCPACGAVGEPWRTTRGRLVCGSCRHQSSVTAGTIFEPDPHAPDYLV